MRTFQEIIMSPALHGNNSPLCYRHHLVMALQVRDIQFFIYITCKNVLILCWLPGLICYVRYGKEQLFGVFKLVRNQVTHAQVAKNTKLFHTQSCYSFDEAESQIPSITAKLKRSPLLFYWLCSNGDVVIVEKWSLDMFQWFIFLLSIINWASISLQLYFLFSLSPYAFFLARNRIQKHNWRYQLYRVTNWDIENIFQCVVELNSAKYCLDWKGIPPHSLSASFNCKNSVWK